ncbi:MAG: hypothetical protein KatS3mg110_0902 [Pirellulaceae bacterium]|nr:MAG: hypothetical protein KatS3mg110_0902 [Pirellulaceae bacterium]
MAGWLYNWRRLTGGLLGAKHLQHSLPAMIDQAAVSLASFATVAILGRYGGESVLGRYYLPLTILLWLTNIQGELVTSAYAVYRQRMHGAEAEQYSGSVVVIEMIVASAATGIFLLLAIAAAHQWLFSELLPCFLVLCVAAPFWQFRAFCRYFSFANLDFVSPLVMDLVTTVAQMVLLASLAAAGMLSAAHAHAVLGVASALGVMTLLVTNRPKFSVRWVRVWQDWKRNWSFTRWALASQLIGCASPYIVPWLAATRLGNDAAGLYAAGVNLCGIASLFILGIAHALTPHAARAYASGGPSRLVRVLWQSALAFAAGVGTFVLTVAFGGDYLMQLLYGARFSGMHLVITFLALATFSNSMAIVAGNGLWAMDRPRTNLWADLVTLAVTLLLAWSWCHLWGLAGIAGAVLAGNTAGAATRMWLLWQAVREEWRKAVPVGESL